MRDCADIVFREVKDLPPGWAASSFDRNIDALKPFLKFNVNEEAYPDLPPICYPNLIKDTSKVFRNRIAPEVCNPLPIKTPVFKPSIASTGCSVWQGFYFGRWLSVKSKLGLN
jgi:hypothetical protein